MRLFSFRYEKKLLRSRSSRSRRGSFFFFHIGLLDFLARLLGFLGFLYFFLLGFRFTGGGYGGFLGLDISLRVTSLRLSGECETSEGNGNESSYDCCSDW
jgi:hypothetical protein